MMTTLLEKTIGELRGQSPDVQDCIAQLVHDALHDEAEWARLFSDPRSESWLSGQVADVRAMIAAGKPTEFDPSDLPE